MDNMLNRSPAPVLSGGSSHIGFLSALLDKVIRSYSRECHLFKCDIMGWENVEVSLTHVKRSL